MADQQLAYWQVKGDQGWTHYEDGVSAQIESARLAGTASLDIPSPHGVWRIDLRTSQQVNPATRRARPMRRVVLGSGTSAWEFRDDHGWRSFEGAKAAELEQAHATGTAPRLRLRSGSFAYTVDLGAMQQTNDCTGKRRDVRRRAPGGGGAAAAPAPGGGGAAAAPAAAPAAAAAAGGQWNDTLQSCAASGDCPICMDTMEDPVLIVGASPQGFCRACITQQFDVNGPKCPVTNKVVGVLTGKQPEGSMDVANVQESCDGYPGYGSFRITYSFPDGVQGAKHPSPGAPYGGTTRTAYLPADAEGTKVLALLRVAFQRKLIFTVGDSVTSGAKNTTTWSGIHHKTRASGGSHGFPDATYLTRVQEELALKGVVFTAL